MPLLFTKGAETFHVPNAAYFIGGSDDDDTILWQAIECFDDMGIGMHETFFDVLEYHIRLKSFFQCRMMISVSQQSGDVILIISIIANEQHFLMFNIEGMLHYFRELRSMFFNIFFTIVRKWKHRSVRGEGDRKSTRLNSSH